MKPETQFVNLPLNDSSYEASLEKYFKETWEFSTFENFSSQVFGQEQTNNDNKVIKDLLHRFQNNALDIEQIQDKKLLFGVCLACDLNDLAMAFADKSKMSYEELAYYALRQKSNHQFLRLLLDKGISLDPDWKPTRYGNNWLVYATLSTIENLRLVFNHFDAQTLKRLTYHNLGSDSVLKIATSRRTEDLEEILKLFSSVGINFNVKDREGKYPTQHHTANQVDSRRQDIFKQFGIANTMSLETAIAMRNVEAVEMNLRDTTSFNFTFIFEPSSDDQRINRPYYLKNDELIHGGYNWSPRIPFFNYAIYCGDTAIVKLLVDNILTLCYRTEQKVKLLADNITYVQETAMQTKSNDPARVQKLEMIEKYLQGRLTEAQFELPPKSNMKFYQPAKPKSEAKPRYDYDDWKAPVYS